MRIDNIDKKRNFGLIVIPETPKNIEQTRFIKGLIINFKKEISGSWVGQDEETGNNVLLLMTKDDSLFEKRIFAKLKNFLEGVFTAPRKKFEKAVEEQQKHQEALDVYSTEQVFIESVSKVKKK